MYKLNSRNGSIVEISNVEFSNDFTLKNPNVPIAVLTEVQSVAHLNDFFYALNFELLEYIRDHLNKPQLEMFTLGEIPFFANTKTDRIPFSKFIRDICAQDLPADIPSSLNTSSISFEKWPWVFNLATWASYPRISKLAAFQSLLDYDASGAINLLSVCESLLNHNCCAFTITEVIDSLRKIENSNVSELLDLKIPLPNNQFLKIESPIGLVFTNSMCKVDNGRIVEFVNSRFYEYSGFNAPFKANRSDEWCDLKGVKFLITSVYSHRTPQTPLKSMIYTILPREIPLFSAENLLQAHKYLLKDHFLRLVVCLKKNAEDPTSSFLPTHKIFAGIDTKIKDDQSYRKHYDVFLGKTSPELKESIILDPLFQTAMDVRSDDLENLYMIYQNRTDLAKSMVLPILLGVHMQQKVKFEVLKFITPNSNFIFKKLEY